MDEWKEMFYLTTHSTHFYLLLYYDGHMVVRGNLGRNPQSYLSLQKEEWIKDGMKSMKKISEGCRLSKFECKKSNEFGAGRYKSSP